MAGLPPNGPPAVSLGALWPSSDGKYLYQYAGEFSDAPPTSPTTQLLWRYDIAGGTWSSINSHGDGVTRPAEGATCVVPNKGTNNNGIGVYLGGHLDAYTVPGWSVQVARKYLQSMILFDAVLITQCSHNVLISGLGILQKLLFTFLSQSRRRSCVRT